MNGIPVTNLDKLEAIHEIQRFGSKKYGLFSRSSFFFYKPGTTKRIYRINMKKDTLITGYGTSKNHTQALKAALGETLERYSWSIELKGHLRDKNYKELKERGHFLLSPKDLKLYEDWQYKNKEFNLLKYAEDKPVASWIQTEKFSNEIPVWIPTGMVSMDKKNRYREITTNGLACHKSRNKAIWNALCEVLERDCFSLSWWSKARLPSLSEDIAEVRSIKKEFRFSCKEIRLAYTTNEIGLPVVIGQVINDTIPFTTLAAACKPDLKEAIEKVFMELVQIQSYDNQRESFQIPKRVRSFQDVYDLYATNKEAARWTEFLIDSKREVIPKTMETENLEDLLSRFQNHGFGPLLIEFTTRDVKRQGYHVVQTLVPGMVPINANDLYRPLACKRLWRGRRILNALNKNEPLKNLNPHPSPFS